MEVDVSGGNIMDGLNDVLERIEAALQERGFFARASVAIDASHLLTFGKLAHQWRLILESAPDSQSPLTNASLEYRMLAVEKLDELAVALEQAKAKREDEVSAATARAAEFLRRL
jgi:hypothetical protein